MRSPMVPPTADSMSTNFAALSLVMISNEHLTIWASMGGLLWASMGRLLWADFYGLASMGWLLWAGFYGQASMGWLL